MHMDRFVAFIGKEVNSPSFQADYGWHVLYLNSQNICMMSVTYLERPRLLSLEHRREKLAQLGFPEKRRGGRQLNRLITGRIVSPNDFLKIRYTVFLFKKAGKDEGRI